MAKKIAKRNKITEPQEILQQTQRILSWSSYQDSIRELDTKIIIQLQQTISNLRIAFWINAITHFLFFIFFGTAFFYGLRILINESTQQLWGGVISLVSLLLSGIMIYRNPTQGITRVVVDLAKIQVILQEYTRQLNQVDATFKQALLSGSINISDLNDSLDHIQTSIDGIIENLIHSIEDIEI